ncbi:MAG TPA: hypothetical protein VMS02_07590, partial [Solirubrobacteraceae bacterium]|nr:hypothetical protein [Solirubrobacteraceae bacterium]
MPRRSIGCALALAALPLSALSPPGAAAAAKSASAREAASEVTVNAGAAAAKSATSTSANPETPVPVEASDNPPVGRFLSADQVLEIAGRLPKMRRVRGEFPGSYGGAYLKGANRWQVSYFSRGGKEIGQVIVADRTGHVLEQWTGFQIAWAMARGYQGAFGRHVNSLYIWIPLCVLFFVPFFDWRDPLRLLHFDLLALLSFSVSLAFFNHGRIALSTPLAYPPLLYLLARMLAVGGVRLRRRPRRPPRPERPAALLI